MLRIGERVRAARLRHNLSQGDLENRTGLLRCYLSRVENGHTEPSLQTLVRIATALEMPLVDFFAEPGETTAQPPALNDQDFAFLAQMRQYASMLSSSDRQQVLELARRMADSNPAPGAGAGLQAPAATAAGAGVK